MATTSKLTKEVVSALSGPPPSKCKSETIDLAGRGLSEYKDHFAILIEDILSPAECELLLNAAQSTTEGKWDQALVNIGNGQQALMTDTRLCDRILWDEKEIVQKLQDRIMPHLPPEIVTLQNAARITGWGPVRRKETWKISRLNERLRFLRYTKGMYFKPHRDGSYVTPDGTEISFLTVHIYLNGSSTAADERKINDADEQKPLRGGATRFFGARDEEYDINPATGSCLVFQHRNLIHSGEDVIQGTKYTLRTDVMYHKVPDE